MDVGSLARAIAGAALLAYVPGLAWTLALAPELRGPARHVVAVALSLALVTLTLWTANAALGIPLRAWSAVGLAIGLTLLGGSVAWARARTPYRRPGPPGG